MKVIEEAVKAGRQVLTEHESYQVLEAYHIPVARRILVEHFEKLAHAARGSRPEPGDYL